MFEIEIKKVLVWDSFKNTIDQHPKENRSRKMEQNSPAVGAPIEPSVRPCVRYDGDYSLPGSGPNN